jgi:hypothetical protein
MMAVLQIIIANNHLLSPLSPSETLFRFNNIFYSKKKLFQLILTEVLKIMKNCLKKRNSRKCGKIEFVLRKGNPPSQILHKIMCGFGGNLKMIILPFAYMTQKLKLLEICCFLTSFLNKN